MATTKKTIVGFLLVIVTLATITIIFNNGQTNLKIAVAKDKTTFSINESGTWKTQGIEYLSIKGATLNKALSNISSKIEWDLVNIYRRSYFSDGSLIIDNYVFNGSLSTKESFPVDHSINVLYAKGKTFQYKITQLPYSGPARKNVQSPLQLGKMRVDFPNDFKTSTLSATGILTLTYVVGSDDQIFNIRLFDPSINWYVASWGSNTNTGGINDPLLTFDQAIINVGWADQILF